MVMHAMPIYLDHNATTPVDPRVVEAMTRIWRDYGANPASQHSAGRRSRRVLEEARESIASILGAKAGGMDADRVIFTSGGTEANNLALLGLTASPDKAVEKDVIISAIEHPSIVAAAEELKRRDIRVHKAPVNIDGLVPVDPLSGLLSERTQLVSVMLANNETGVVQPIAEIAALCARRGILLHTDAVQAVGKLPISFRSLGVAAMTVAPHKFHGPVGIGALLVRHDVKLLPQLFGGFQQAAERPGTESIALAAGFARALELWQAEGNERAERMRTLRDQLEGEIKKAVSDAVIIGQNSPRLPHVSNIAFPGINRQALVMALDMAGIACSTGSACASGSSEPSPVLVAMGLPPPVVEGSIRLSLGAFTSDSEIADATKRILKCVSHLRPRK